MYCFTPDFKMLSKYLPKESILKEWGGELEFDIEAYINWRARKEGVLNLTDEVRRFAPGASDQHDRTIYSSISAQQACEFLPPPSKVGPVRKKGSGSGKGLNRFLGAGTWKTKLLCVGPPGYSTYFDSLEVGRIADR
jgi:hypothetical protein